MDSDQGKLFIGGISWETNEDKLKDYFQRYGQVVQAVVMRDKVSGKPRGFGFVDFADHIVLDSVLQDKHTIDGRTVEAKRALPREEQQISKAGNGNHNGGGFGGGGGGGNNRTKKIFVGGLPPALTEEEFRRYFESYGNVTDVVVMFDQQTTRPRGFGFITFDSEDAVDRVLHKTFHDLSGKQVEVKRAFPKDASNPNSGARSTNGNYQGYSGNKSDSNRFLPSQNTGGGGGLGYPAAPYGSSGYGYPQNGVMGYGGYGGFAGTNSFYGGDLSGSGYGNPNAPGSGPRSPWGSQGPTGYGSIGYGNTPYGGGGGGGGAAAGPSPSGMVGYMNQGYGSYSGFVGNAGRAGGGPPRINSPAAGGIGTGELHGSGRGYVGGYSAAGGGYGYGSAVAYPSSNYGSNGTHGSRVGYESNYSGMPGRHS